ncbi:MAG TPA: tetratricopeptide repeat protein [Pyrinomonadaceae bacterium]|nr:tetratricopeptide repeat protein [Pyrinomonadaceae bacterium]
MTTEKTSVLNQHLKTPAQSLILVLLLVTACVTPADVGARITQDAKRDDFANRLPPPVSDAAKLNMETQLAAARANYEANPNDAEALIWFGRRLAYPGHFREAIEVYTQGIEKFPNDARLYRHRGHRYITLRKFALAITDFEKAAALSRGNRDEVEPDGQPNAKNIPTSTLQFNIWYHLGLAYYLTGQNNRALRSYRECLKVSKNPDALVATSHWLYMTLRRLDRGKEAAQVLAPIRPGMEIVENDGYYRLLLMYKRQVSPETLRDDALKQGSSPGAHSILYGIGNWYSYNGRRKEALGVFQQILATDQWTSFGYIAAEVDAAKLTAQSR